MPSDLLPIYYNRLDLALAIGCTVLSVELIFYIKWSNLVHSLLIGIQKTLLSIFDHSMDDEQRELALRYAAFSMLSVSFRILGILILISLIFFGDDLLHRSTFSSTQGFFIKFVSALIYWPIRLIFKKVRKKNHSFVNQDSGQDYSEISKALHSFALDDPLVAKLSFQLEKKYHLQKCPTVPIRPLWVCGLARAGTTILTDLLYDTGHFTSLTYRHMPFPLAPNLWRTLSRLGINGSTKSVERAHGDGLLVNIDSPEALEEVFWRVHEPQVYQDPQLIRSHIPTSNTLKSLQHYMTLVLQSGANPISHKRYLSKNNNHLVRLPSLINHFSQAQFIIPLRHPLEHAESLRRQHQRWVERHKHDDFSKSYMTWLAHHEFGSAHKMFKFNEIKTTVNEGAQEDLSSLIYWAERWFEAYTLVDSLSSPQIVIVDYDDLSLHPEKTLSALFKWLNIDLSQDQTIALASRLKPAPKRVNSDNIDPKQLSKLEDLYRSLYSKCLRG